MTAQKHDKIMYQGEDYAVVGVKGMGLFDPAEHGLAAQSPNTGCWRGFACEYAVKGNILCLHRLMIGLDEKKPLPMLWGHSPHKITEYFYGRKFWIGRKVLIPHTSYEYYYTGLDRLIEYSGGLLIGNNFIETMYVHQGYQKAYRYENVHELTFSKGILTEIHNVSDKMANYRRVMSRQRAAQEMPSENEIKQWVNDCYDLDYSKWFKL